MGLEGGRVQGIVIGEVEDAARIVDGVGRRVADEERLVARREPRAARAGAPPAAEEVETPEMDVRRAGNFGARGRSSTIACPPPSTASPRRRRSGTSSGIVQRVSFACRMKRKPVAPVFAIQSMKARSRGRRSARRSGTE